MSRMPRSVAQLPHAAQVVRGRRDRPRPRPGWARGARPRPAPGRTRRRARRGRRRRRARSLRAAARRARASRVGPWRAASPSVRPWNDVPGAHDHVAARARPLAGELDRALVGLGARVAEEDLPAGARRPAADRGGRGSPPPRGRRRCRRGSTRAGGCAPVRRGPRPPPGGHGRARSPPGRERKSRYRLPSVSHSSDPAPRTKVTGGSA